MIKIAYTFIKIDETSTNINKLELTFIKSINNL